MANEIHMAGEPALTIYAIAYRGADNKVWQVTTSTFVSFVLANRANYVLTMTESATGTGFYSGNFSPGTTANTHNLLFYKRLGASVAATDEHIGIAPFVWDGTSETVTDATVTSATSSASAVELVNIALTKLGQQRITALSDNNERARVANAIYDRTKDAVLAGHEWNCAVTRTTLAASTATPTFGPSYAYPVPSDFIRFARLENSRDQFRIEVVNSNRSIVSDLSTLNLVYIFRLEDVAKMDEYLKQAIIARLAWEMAIPLVESKSLADTKRREYEQIMADAMFTDSVQGPISTMGGQTWLDGRLVAPSGLSRTGWADSV